MIYNCWGSKNMSNNTNNNMTTNNGIRTTRRYMRHHPTAKMIKERVKLVKELIKYKMKGKDRFEYYDSFRDTTELGSMRGEMAWLIPDVSHYDWSLIYKNGNTGFHWWFYQMTGLKRNPQKYPNPLNREGELYIRKLWK